LIDIKGWNWIRWLSVLLYLGITSLFVGALFAFPGQDVPISSAMSVFIIVGMAPLFLVLNIPYLMNRRSARIPDSTMDRSNGPPKGWTGEFLDSVRMDILPLIMVPLMIISSISVILSPDLIVVLITVPVMIVLGISLIFFWKLDIRSDKEVLSFHFGPIGRTLRMEDIVSIRPAAIHGFRDYMGWGLRSGSDGSIGYISFSRTGVRIETVQGKTYVVSCHRPKELSDHVKWSRKMKRSG
jgi:hypothetical protein